MLKPSQDIIDKLVSYFDTNGIELSVENGEKLPLDEKILKRDPPDKWSIDVLVLTSSGILPAYYRHENKEYTVKGIMPFDIFIRRDNHPRGKATAEMLSYKYVDDNTINTADIRKIIQTQSS